MPGLSGNKSRKGDLSSRLSELGIVLPAPPTPLGNYVESSDTGNLLFLSGILPIADGKLAISGRLATTFWLIRDRKQRASLRLKRWQPQSNI